MDYIITLTQLGREVIAQKMANNEKLDIKYIAVGDGNGSPPSPTGLEISLVREVWRGNLADSYVHRDNPHWAVFEVLIPFDEGNFWIREVGIFDAQNRLIAYGNYPDTFKPEYTKAVTVGSVKEVFIQFIVEILNAGQVLLEIDPSIALAKKTDIVHITNIINQHIADPAAHGDDSHTVDGHHAGNNANEVLVIGQDGKVPATNLPIANATRLGVVKIGSGLEIDATGLLNTKIVDVLPIGVMFFYPGSVAPEGYLGIMGQTISQSTFPDLIAYANANGLVGSGKLFTYLGNGNYKLADSRGLFPRVHDAGRGVDPGRNVGSYQEQSELSLSVNIPWHYEYMVYRADDDKHRNIPCVGTNSTPPNPLVATGGSTGDNRPKNINVGMLIIKAKNVAVDANVEGGNALTLGGYKATDFVLKGQLPPSVQVSVITGTIAHGATLPLPAGYTQAQCRWMVSIYSYNNYNSGPGDGAHYCWADPNTRVVTAYTQDNEANRLGTASYIVIGVK